MNKNIRVMGVMVTIILLVAISGCTNTTNNTPNITSNITEKNSVGVNDVGVNDTVTYISAERAKELASQYTGMGVGKGTLGKPTFTTFNGLKAWKFPVNGGYYNIYINAVTGQRIPNN